MTRFKFRTPFPFQVLRIASMNHDCFYEDHNYAELEYELACVTKLSIEHCYGDGLHCLVAKCRQSLQTLRIVRN